MSSGASRGASKGGSKNKPNKSDSKSDKIDLNPKIQPTAEQMQIARIIDTHRSEEPELQKKIRQVMEITRSTEDEASMALHSREYDIEQAITLLTEGGSQSLESEWAQAGKKRKPKTPSQKADLAREKDRGAGKESGDRGGRERSEKRERDSRTERIDRERKDSEAGDGQTFSNEPRRGGDRLDRGGRGGPRRGGRGGIGRGGRIDNNKENDEANGTRGSYGDRGGGGYGRMANGPGRGGRGGTGGRGGRGSREGGGRTFANRARGRDGDSSYNTIDVWENSQADAPTEAAPLKVDNWDEFPSAEDWDNEEYTGSLADTKVFTPSSQPQGAPPLTDATNGVGPGGPTTNHIVNATSAGSAPGDVKISSGNQDSVGAGPGVNMSSVVAGLNTASGGSNVVSGQSIDINMLLQKPQSTTDNSDVLVRSAGANLLATLQSSYTNNQVQVGPPGNQALPARHKVQRPRGPVSKIPSSAVEMPDDAVTTLDVQFGGMDFGTDTSMSFNSVMHSGKPGGDLLYGGPPPKMDTFSAAGDKEVVQSKVAPPPSQSPFQSQRNTGASLVEPSKGSTITPSIDTHSLSMQTQKNQTQQPSYTNVNASNAGSAFVSYGKGAPGFPAPGFPPVTAVTGSVTYNNSNTGGAGPVAGGSSYGTQNALQSQQQQPSGYHNMSNIPYNSQPVVSATQVSQVQPQPVIPSATQHQNVGTVYGGSSVPNQNPYHHANANSNSGYVNSSGGNQYGGYAPKMSSSLAASTGSGGHSNAKDLNDGTSNVAVSTPSSVSSAQLGTNLQSGSVITAASSASNTKLATTANTTNNTSGSKMGNTSLPPGMVMQPQYILGQGAAVPTFYSVQTPFYGFDENAVQLLPRLPHHMAGYYDANTATANYGAGAQAGVAARNDGAALPAAYSAGADGRYTRSDSSTASPVPSNLAGGNTQAMYTPGLPGYYYLGNNVVHGTPFPYAPPHMYQTTPMAAGTNPSGAPHAASANHQYPNKSVYGAQYTYDQGQGPTTDFSKNSYTGSTGVGPNSNAGKGPSGTTAGTSQSTDLNTSMYAKGHNMNKINSYDKGYGANTSGGYNNSIGAQTNALNSQLGGAGMGAPYGVYIAQPPVQTLAMHQDGSNASRQGAGQPKGNKQQYGTPYWSN